MRRDLITGSSGFIGGHLKKALPKAIGLDIRPAMTTDILKDVCKFESFIRWGVVYHMAALADVSESIKRPIETFRSNIAGTINILRLNYDLLIFPSTVADPSKSPYGFSKFVCEEIIKRSGKPYIIFRFANIYGEGAKSVVQKFLSEPVMKIYGDGKQVRDYTYIDDLIKHLIDCRKLYKRRLYYIGTGVPTSVNDLAILVNQLQGKKWVHVAPREGDIGRPIIRADLKCTTELKEGIKKCCLNKNS